MDEGWGGEWLGWAWICLLVLVLALFCFFGELFLIVGGGDGKVEDTDPSDLKLQFPKDTCEFPVFG